MTGQNDTKSVVAAFDFDGTLTRRESFFPFLMHAAGKRRFMRRMPRVLPTLAGYGLGIVANQTAKEQVLSRMLGGMPLEELQRTARDFAHRKLPLLLAPRAMARVLWHQQQGHRCVLVSASLELYLEPWATETGFHDVIATRLAVGEDGTITGKLVGANCYGAEKARRLEVLLGPRPSYTLYAYGDSRGDREMLALADHPYFREIP